MSLLKYLNHVIGKNVIQYVLHVMMEAKAIAQNVVKIHILNVLIKVYLNLNAMNQNQKINII